jgi:hypothetical protein
MDDSNKPLDGKESSTGSSSLPELAAARLGQPDNAEIFSLVPVCDLCGAIMVERHCKLICMHCGYQRDCSDP